MYRENSYTSQEVKLQLKFPAKNTLALDTNEPTFNRDNANGHSQRGNRKKNWLVEFKDIPKNKSNEKHLETSFTHRHVLMHQSIQLRPAPPPPPSGLTPGHKHFLALDGQFPGVGTLELSNPPGWGRKKSANAPSSVNTATFFIDHTVK